MVRKEGLLLEPTIVATPLPTPEPTIATTPLPTPTPKPTANVDNPQTPPGLAAAIVNTQVQLGQAAPAAAGLPTAAPTNPEVPAVNATPEPTARNMSIAEIPEFQYSDSEDSIDEPVSTNIETPEIYDTAVVSVQIVDHDDDTILDGSSDQNATEKSTDGFLY